jgi:NAD(P)-dependent dehydrogenase (short-subunit alcohol dehydrogenase family)
MLMGVIEGARNAPSYPELAGKRVLITGITSACGVDIVRGFADHKARLILQMDEMSEQTQAIAEIAAQSALDIRSFGPVDRSQEDVVKFAQGAVQAFGGLDVVINLVPLTLSHLQASASAADIERIVAARLMLPHLIAKVVANRMGLVWTEGLVLNVATLPPPGQSALLAFACVIKAALTAMTRTQAEEWAPQGIRCNAIAPQTALVPDEPCLAGEPDIAALALFLASGRGRGLSGHVFEAEPAREASVAHGIALSDYN